MLDLGVPPSRSLLLSALPDCDRASAASRFISEIFNLEKCLHLKPQGLQSDHEAGEMAPLLILLDHNVCPFLEIQSSM